MSDSIENIQLNIIKKETHLATFKVQKKSILQQMQ